KWLKDTKKVNAEWLLNHGDDERLREENKRYLESKKDVVQAEKEVVKHSSHEYKYKEKTNENEELKGCLDLFDFSNSEELNCRILYSNIIENLLSFYLFPTLPMPSEFQEQ